MDADRMYLEDLKAELAGKKILLVDPLEIEAMAEDFLKEGIHEYTKDYLTKKVQ